MQHRRAGTTLAADRETEGEAKRGCGLAVVEQNLTLFLFLRHTDPFTSELCDVLGESQAAPNLFQSRFHKTLSLAYKCKTFDQEYDILNRYRKYISYLLRNIDVKP